MLEVLAIVRREYLSRVKSKWFLFSTLGVPAVAVAVFFINTMASGSGSQWQRLVLVDETGTELAATALEPLEAAGYRVEIATGSDANRSALDARLSEGDIGGYVVLDEETLDRGLVRMTAESRPSAIRRMVLQTVLVNAAVQMRYGDEADAVAALLKGGELEIAVAGQEGPSERQLAKPMRSWVGRFSTSPCWCTASGFCERSSRRRRIGRWR